MDVSYIGCFPPGATGSPDRGSRSGATVARTRSYATSGGRSHGRTPNASEPDRVLPGARRPRGGVRTPCEPRQGSHRGAGPGDRDGERSGIWFRDAYTGERYVSCHCNGGVFNLGHRHPQVLAALDEALDHSGADIGNHHLVSPWRALLAQRLSATTDDTLGAVFGVSGGEAIDLAIKVKRAHTGRSGVISAVGGYHGHTGLAHGSGRSGVRDPFGANLSQVPPGPFDDLSRSSRGRHGPGSARAIPAALGMAVPSPYLPGCEALCDERGALLCFDEVQTRLGRTGTVWYRTQEHVRPDLVTGKGALRRLMHARPPRR
ncbi:MAG: aminotransferase class III-fold pyridoxal phosphate-dependent enzyme [Microthrixaceae bacterium]